MRAGIWLAIVPAALVGLMLFLPDSGAAQATKRRETTEAGARNVDPQAERVLRRMGEFLGRQNSFTLRGEGNLEAILESGQKVDFGSRSQVYVRRPDRLRVDRSGDLADVQLYYDGKNLTLYGQRTNLYATAPAPGRLDAALEKAQDRLNIGLGAGDLLYQDVADVLMDGVTSGSYLGTSVVAGALTHHLAFQEEEVDWQLWVEDGPRPLPRRYVITSKQMEGAPEYSVTFTDWQLDAELSDDLFTFRPPRESERINFADVPSEAVSRQ